MTERERTEAMRRDFVANVSHEIRTPLTVLSGFLETMRNLPLTEVEQKRVITLMSQQAERMADLVADLLTLARLEGSPRPTCRALGRRRRAVRSQVEAEARGAVGRPARDRLRRRRARRRSPAARASCRARSATSSATPFATRPTAADRGRAGASPATAAARSPSPTPAAASPASTCRGSPSASIASTAAARASRAAPAWAWRSSSTSCSAMAASSTSRASSARARRSGSSFRPCACALPCRRRRRRRRPAGDDPADDRAVGALSARRRRCLSRAACRGGRCR